MQHGFLSNVINIFFASKAAEPSGRIFEHG